MAPFCTRTLHAVGDLDGDEALADVVDATGDAAVGDHFVALGQLVQQVAVFLLRASSAGGSSGST